MKDDTAKDRDRTVALGDTDTMTSASTGALAHLRDLDDCKIADGEPDIRGWDVKGADGTKVGEVSDLLVDTGALKVRYVEVKLDAEVAKQVARADVATAPTVDPTRYVLVPIGVARLDEEHDDVCLDAHAAQMAGIPAYERGPVSREYETGLLRGYDRQMAGTGSAGARATPTDFYADRHFDDRAFFSPRRKGRPDAPYIARAAAGAPRAGQ